MTGFLVRNDILTLGSSDVIEGFDASQVTEWAYDIRVGREAYISSKKEIRRLQDNESIVIEPGETALILTDEFFRIPKNLGAFITLKLSKKRKGLINVSGFHVDPGFHGHILFSVFNAGPQPVFMRQGEPAFSIFFFDLGTQTGGRGVGSNHQNIKRISSAWVEEIAGPPFSLVDLSEKLKDLAHQVGNLKTRVTRATTAFWTIAGGVVVGVVVWYLTR